MKSALMVAEKPSLAASLAKILSNGKNSTRKGTATHTPPSPYSGRECVQKKNGKKLRAGAHKLPAEKLTFTIHHCAPAN